MGSPTSSGRTDSVGLLALVSLLAADAFSGTLSTSAIFMAALGAVLICVYLWGLLERSDRSVASLGIDSVLVVVLYLAGVGALYGLDRNVTKMVNKATCWSAAWQAGHDAAGRATPNFGNGCGVLAGQRVARPTGDG